MDTTSIATAGPARTGSTAGGEAPSVTAGPQHTPDGAHRGLSVGLLGDSAGYLAVAIRASTIDDDPARARDAAETLTMFRLVFGIPLSFAALLTGVALGIGTKWGPR